MAEARQREAWEHTATILAMLANANRDPKKRAKPFLPSDFNPFATPAAARDTRVEVPFDALRWMFCREPAAKG